MKPFQRIQKKVICLITFSNFDAHVSPLCAQLNILKLKNRIKLQTTSFMLQFVNGKLPNFYQNFRQAFVNIGFATRS